MSDTVLRNDFDQCVTLYKDMIQQQTAQERKSLNVSVTETEGNDDKSGDRKKQNQRGMISADQVEDRFYDPKEYQKLTPDAKLKLKRMREKRGHTPKSKKQKSQKYSLKKKDIRAIAAAVTESRGGDDESPITSDDETERVDNRNNRNLTRQQGRRRSGR